MSQEKPLSYADIKKAWGAMVSSKVPRDDIRNYATHIFTVQFQDGCEASGFLHYPSLEGQTLKLTCRHGITEEFRLGKEKEE